jgi:hypothetical protein
VLVLTRTKFLVTLLSEDCHDILHKCLHSLTYLWQRRLRTRRTSHGSVQLEIAHVQQRCVAKSACHSDQAVERRAHAMLARDWTSQSLLQYIDSSGQIQIYHLAKARTVDADTGAAADGVRACAWMACP